jgi:hypothetical protein
MISRRVPFALYVPDPAAWIEPVVPIPVSCIENEPLVLVKRTVPEPVASILIFCRVLFTDQTILLDMDGLMRVYTGETVGYPALDELPGEISQWSAGRMVTAEAVPTTSRNMTAAKPIDRAYFMASRSGIILDCHYPLLCWHKIQTSHKSTIFQQSDYTVSDPMFATPLY